MKTNLGRMYAIGVLSFILFLSTLMGAPVLPALSEELGARTAQIPIVVSAALATVVVAQLFTGFLSDRYSKRALILTGALIGSVSSLLCAVASDWTQLLAFRIAGGIADAVSMPALLAITASLAEDRPGRFFGILRGSQGLSFTIGPALGSALSLISLRAPFIADGLLSLAALAAAVIVLKDMGKLKPGHDLRLFQGVRSVFADKKVFIYLLLGVSGLFGWGILASFVPTRAQLIGLEAWQIGMILTMASLAFSLVAYAVGFISDRFGRKRFAVLSQMIMIGAAFGLARSDSFVSLLVLYSLFCVGEAATFLLSFVYASQVFEQKYMATSMAVFDSIIDLSLLLGPLVGVLAYGLNGQIQNVFLIAVIPAALAFLAAFRLPGDAR